MKIWAILLLAAAFLVSCKKEIKPSVYQTENVVIVVIDGPRISETWDHPTRQYIPFQNELLKEGVLVSNFRNNGPTWTMCGHGALVTGKFAWIDNSGMQSPDVPTIFQQFRSQKHLSADQTWIVASKGKIAALANSEKKGWYDHFIPFTDCGVGGLGATSGYRHDSTTYKVVTQVMSKFHPKLLLINFREPDYSGHQADSVAYLRGIMDTDAYVHKIWKFIQSDPVYKNKTALFVTSDHGRHLDGIADGFAGHGDGCEGCRHVALLALGPDFKKNTVITTTYEQIDLPSTIARILKFNLPHSDGKVITELFK